ncbi:MAG: hypothetical protein H0X03_08285 [Nitrosopumilus sp.]|nr:hypothetical protein [Nitrosopumilus sp.]
MDANPNLNSTQKIPKDAMELNKLTKVSFGYLEISSFKNSDTHKRYFCYNCIYCIDSMGGKCMIFDDESPDVPNNKSRVIAAHGYYNRYQSIYDKQLYTNTKS